MDAAFRPFCSQRCKLADLGQWLSGSYRIEGAPMTDTDPDEGEAPPEFGREPNSSTH